MARTLAFDRTHVVQQARTVFWSRGFEAASIPELEAATGLSRSSIYNSFGSKRGLFDAAVDSYLEDIIRPRLRPLTSPTVTETALDEYLAALAEALSRADSQPANHGCLLINSANAPIAEDPHVARVVGAYRAELQAAMDRGLAAAQPALGTDARELLAETITGLVIAAFALARIDRQESVRLVESARKLARANV